MSIKNIINPIIKPGLNIELNGLKVGNINFPKVLGNAGDVLISDGLSNVVFGASIKNLINSAIYRPGGVSSQNVFANWNDVVDFINATNGDVLLYFDDSIVSPCIVSSNVNLQSRVQILPYRNNINAVQVKINDGVVITNPNYINGPIDILCTPTLAIPFNLTNDGNFLFLSQNAKLKFDGVPSLPFVEASGSNTQIIALFRGSGLDNSLSPGSPILKLNDTSTGVLAAALGSDYGVNTVDGVVGTSLLLVHDAATSSPSMIGFLGTRLENIFDRSESVYYDDGVLPNLVPVPTIAGSPSVQNAIDGIKNLFNNTLGLNNLTSMTMSVTNQPLLSMFQSGTQNLALTTLDVVQFDSTEITIGNPINYNLGVFTIQSDGIYSVSYSICWVAVSGTLTAYVERNNTSRVNHYSYNILDTSVVQGHCGSFTTKLNAGDTLTYFIYHGTGVGPLSLGAIGAGTSKMIISKLM